MPNDFEAAFLGVGGSCPYSNPRRVLYKGNTSCVALRAGGDTLVFDAGSGICGFGGLSTFQSNRLHLFFSHYHADHLNGLMFWNAWFNGENDIHIYGPPSELGGVRAAIDQFLRNPYHPAGLNDANAQLTLTDIRAGERINISDNLTVKTISLSHPGGCLGYRVEYNKRTFCYLTDVELVNHRGDANLAAFAENAGLAVIDASYLNGRSTAGWGHSTPSECAALAKQANIKRLALFHFHYSYSDAEIQTLEAQARAEFPGAFAPADNQIVGIEPGAQ